MKIRKGFVTNSSSSSFILHFLKGKDQSAEDAIKEELNEQMQIYQDWIREQLTIDAINNTITREEAKDEIVESCFWNVMHDIEEEFGIDYRWDSNTKDWNWFDKDGNDVSEKYDAMCKERCEKLAEEELWWNDNERNIYAMVSYGTDINYETSVLEYDVLPNLYCTAYKISHHQESD